MKQRDSAETLPTRQRRNINWGKWNLPCGCPPGSDCVSLLCSWPAVISTHNNHHAYPTSARHGLRWYEIDFNWLGIRALQLVGLAHAIKRVHFNRTASAWQLVSGRVRS
ncbi:MAG TPA: hypothetical protein VJM12_06510 [Pyrinomonadaceae bacterium]|nr:hypothetical protein [Pyrinomonadaceae bacterium]